MKNPLASISLRDTKDSNVLAQRIAQMPLAGKAWQQIKSFYKANEAVPNANVFVALLQKLDQAKHDTSLDRGVSDKTLAYMKRRAIRALKNLAKADQDKFVIVVLSFLKLQTTIEPYQWITNYLLYGNSKRIKQSRHGRGLYIASENVGNLYRNEEQHTQIWDENIKLVEALLFKDGLDVRIYEFAVKVLLRNQKALPVFPRNQILHFYKSGSPWLQWTASQQCVDALGKGVKMDAYMMAHTFLYSSPKLQSSFGQYLSSSEIPQKETSKLGQIFSKVFSNEASKEMNLKAQFVNFLATLMFSQAADLQLNRRHSNVLSKLEKDKTQIKLESIAKYLPQLFASKKDQLEAFGFYFADKLHAGQINTFLSQLEVIQPSSKFRLYDSLLKKNKGDLGTEKFVQKALLSEQFHLADFAWYCLSKSSWMQDKVTKQFVRGHFYRGWRSKALQNAVKSQYAGDLLAPVLKEWDYYLNHNIKLVIQMYKHGFGELRNLAKAKILENGKNQFANYLFLLRGLTDRDEICNNIFTKIKAGNAHYGNVFSTLVSKDAWVQDWGWKLLETHCINETAIRQLTQQIVFYQKPEEVEPVIQKILNHSNSALKTHFVEGIEFMLAQNAWWINRVVPVIQKHINHFEPASIIKIIKAVDDRSWEKIQPLVSEYAASEKGASFWLEVMEVIPEEESTVLAERILNDEKLRGQLLALPDVSILNIKHPIYADVLKEWLELHGDLLGEDVGLWFKACTHKLSPVRSWALKNLPQSIQDQAFMLQLLESEIPNTMAFAKSYFESAIAKKQMSLDHILALCDSPNAIVRTYGMELFEKEKQQLDTPTALECLAEHSDPRVQAFVAEEITKQDISSTFVKSFDRSILRNKQRSRKAKETVKKRIEKNLQIDVSTLLEMSRGRNKKDAEWAIQQLTKIKIASDAQDGSILLNLNS